MYHVRRLFSVLLAVTFLAILLPTTPSKAAECSPTNTIKYISPYNDQSGYVKGKVRCVNVARHCIATYIGIEVDPLGSTAAGWWTKPSFNQPCKAIKPNGTWRVDITTGGVDYAAVYAAVFVVKKKYDVPLLGSVPELPLADELCLNSKASRLVTRATDGSGTYSVSKLCPPTTAPVLP